MDALTLLTTRKSNKKLTVPAPNAEQLERIFEAAMRVPDWEQMLSAGCATYGLQLAAQAQGFDNVWISGKWVNGTALREAFGCREQDRVIALVMIGTSMEKAERECRIIDTKDFVTYL